MNNILTFGSNMLKRRRCLLSVWELQRERSNVSICICSLCYSSQKHAPSGPLKGLASTQVHNTPITEDLTNDWSRYEEKREKCSPQHTRPFVECATVSQECVQSGCIVCRGWSSAGKKTIRYHVLCWAVDLVNTAQPADCIASLWSVQTLMHTLRSPETIIS